MRGPPSLLRTGLIVLWTFVVASLVWTRFSSFYIDGIATAGNVLLPGGVWLDALAQSIVVRSVVDGETYREPINSLVLHSGLLIVVALVVGTPCRSLRWRLLAAACTGACFFLVQVAGVTEYALMLDRSLSGATDANDVSVGFAIFWALTPMIAGGAWTYRYWLPAFRPAPPIAETGNDTR